MNGNRIIFLVVAVLIPLVTGYFAELNIYEVLSIGLFVYFLLNFIDSFGKSYNLLDITILLAIFQCLLMPAIIYNFYNSDYIVIALRYDMGVPEEVYYGFMLPAIIALIIGLKLPLQFRAVGIKQLSVYINNAKSHLIGKGNLGILLIIIGVVSGVFQLFIPGELNYVAYLFGKLLYVGILYTFYSDDKRKAMFLIGGVVVALSQSLSQGMFGELIFTLVLSVMLILLGKKIRGSVKAVLVVVGIIFIFLIQSIKGEYRSVTWYGKGNQEQSKTEAFFSILTERITTPSRFFDLDVLFPFVNRFNQGMIVSKVMTYVPASAPFAGGETITTSLAASFIPRLFWADKPISGGKWNMERFTGFIIEGYSMNISPMGEAYGNFGTEGGIVFMFVYGLFFNVAILILITLSKTRPTLILWIPILFLNSLQVETDILMCVNSLIKTSIFIWFCYWGADRFLRLKL
jgi:hypothetical protein